MGENVNNNNTVSPPFVSLPIHEKEKLLKETKFIWFHFLRVLWSMFIFVVSYLCNICSTVNYYQNGNYWFLGFHLFLVLFAAFYTTVLSDSLNYTEETTNNEVSQSYLIFKFICRMAGGLFPRYVVIFCFGWKVIQAKRRNDYVEMAENYSRMTEENRRAQFILLFERFLKSAPQLVLLLYIIITNDFVIGSVTTYFQIASVVTSVIGLAVTLTLNNRIDGNMQRKHCLSSGVLFPAHLFGIIARFFSLGIFAVVCGSYFYFWIGCLIHWIVMIIWIWMKTESADGMTCMQRIFFGVISGFIHIFAFFNFEFCKHLDRFHYIFYYGICLIENLIAMLLWWQIVLDSPWFQDFVLIGQIGSVILNIIFLGIYYSISARSNSSVLTEICIEEIGLNLKNQKSQSPSDYFISTPLGKLSNIFSLFLYYFLKNAPDF